MCFVQEFKDKAVEQRVLSGWDLAYLPHIRKHLPLIDDTEKREIAEQVIRGFEEEVLPRIHTMTRGIIHGDFNGMNVLLSRSGPGYDITGCIDFGDSIFSCNIFDLAITLAYAMLQKEDDPLNYSGPIVPGYLTAFPLAEAELKCLYYCVLGRMVQSAVTGEAQYKKQPWNSYLLVTHAARFWKVIREILMLGRDKVEKIWSDACLKDYELES